MEFHLPSKKLKQEPESFDFFFDFLIIDSGGTELTHVKKYNSGLLFIFWGELYWAVQLQGGAFLLEP